MVYLATMWTRDINARLRVYTTPEREGEDRYVRDSDLDYEAVSVERRKGGQTVPRHLNQSWCSHVGWGQPPRKHERRTWEIEGYASRSRVLASRAYDYSSAGHGPLSSNALDGGVHSDVQDIRQFLPQSSNTERICLWLNGEGDWLLNIVKNPDHRLAESDGAGGVRALREASERTSVSHSKYLES